MWRDAKRSERGMWFTHYEPFLPMALVTLSPPPPETLTGPSRLPQVEGVYQLTGDLSPGERDDSGGIAKQLAAGIDRSIYCEVEWYLFSGF